MPLKVQQLPQPTIGMELYQLGVQIRAKNKQKTTLDNLPRFLANAIEHWVDFKN